MVEFADPAQARMVATSSREWYGGTLSSSDCENLFSSIQGLSLSPKRSEARTPCRTRIGTSATLLACRSLLKEDRPDIKTWWSLSVNMMRSAC